MFLSFFLPRLITDVEFFNFLKIKRILISDEYYFHRVVFTLLVLPETHTFQEDKISLSVLLSFNLIIVRKYEEKV